MGKNLRPALALVAALACHDAEVPATLLQGVVELDERPLGLELAGRLSGVPARRGQLVKKGETLAVLDDGLERPQRQARVADVRSAEAQLALLLAGSRREDIDAASAQTRSALAIEGAANDAVARAGKLVAGGSVPRAQLEDAQSQQRRAVADRQATEDRLRLLRKGSRREEVAAARARLDAANAALALADARLARLELKAPIDGAILAVHCEPGQVVTAGMPVVTLGDVEHPYLDLFVPQDHLRGVRVGLAASVRVDGEVKPFSAQVEDVGRRTEFTPRYLFSPKERPNLVVRVRLRLDDPRGQLHAGVPASAQLDSPPFREGT